LNDQKNSTGSTRTFKPASLSRADVLRLREYEIHTVELTSTEAVELAALTRGGADAAVIQQVTPSAQAGSFVVQPGPYVGRFTLPSGLTVDIASRFPFTDLLEVLRVASRQPVLLREDATPARPGHGLLELIATAFVREVRRVVGFGLAKGYVTRMFTRPPYPGVPNASAHLARHLGRPDRLITQARRLTVDIPVNQVLAAAHRLLRYQAYSDPDLAVRLRALAPVFAGVTVTSDPVRLSHAATRNMPTRYTQAMALAILVLSGLTTLPAGRGAAGVSVLFNMTKVWENYAQAVLEPNLAPGHSLSPQHPVPLTTDDSHIRAAADLVELDSYHQPVKVYDAKYKPWGDKPSTDEIYQVLTYAYRLGLKAGTLLYPGRGEHNTVAVGEYRIHTVGLEVLARQMD
jgi:5-methylcytosine-specific restriction endonuclease McrBC regulatory subunit McrC